MTLGVVSTLNAMFGTKFGRILVAGEDRECFFDRASMLTPEDFDQLRYGSKVKFDEEADRTHGRRAVRLVIIPNETSPAEEPL